MHARLVRHRSTLHRLDRSLLAICLLAALTAQAHAQDRSSDSEGTGKERELEPIVVTGTRTVGLLPIETLSPVDEFRAEILQNQGTSDLTDSLTKIVPALNTQRFPIADGTAFVRPVSLRNLSPDQTLVMVNGVRRHRSALVNLQLAPLGTVNQGAQAVDFSAIPANAIKRVEVLRDGAAVLYGSDAIAGVVNVILDDSPEGVSVAAQYGEFKEGDGERFIVSADAGFALGASGFLRLSAERSSSDLTSRGVARPDAAQVAEIVGAELVAYDGLGQRWGDPDIDATKFLVNAGIPVGDDMELYGFGSYMDNETLSGFFYRRPVLPPQFRVSGRETLIVDANGDFLPDNAPQALIDSIRRAGLDPANYLTRNSASPSGFVLLNPAASRFPGGYSPLFGADIEDYEVVGGLRGGNAGNLRWDVHARGARNSLDYTLKGSINPSLGSLSPSNFRPGELVQDESEVGVDFTQTFDASPLTLAYGALWRNETYEIKRGDEGSIAVGPTAAVFGVGSDGFQGFFPASTGEFEQDSYAAYVDAEGSINEQWSAAAAVRYEHADRFGSTVVYKLSTRYAFSDDVALRATYNTGFRTPTPGQEFTLNVTTTSDTNGNLIPSGTYPVSDPVAIALGAQPLETETSDNFTLGLVWNVFEDVTATVDFYSTRIDDRIGLVSKRVTQATVNTLIAQNYPNAQLLLNSDASYFANAFGSDVKGIDLVVDARHDVGPGTLNVDVRYNYNKQEVVDVRPNTINADRVFDLENQVPKNRATLTFDYEFGDFDTMARVNYYGNWKTTGGLFGNGDASDAVEYGSGTLLDLELRYRFADRYTLAVGGENVFDKYPGKEQNPVLQFLGVQHALTSPWGFNGAFWYVRVSADF
jgi:iron complex outermembrane receptor protein